MNQKGKGVFSPIAFAIVSVTIICFLFLFGCATLRSTHSPYVVEKKLQNVPFITTPVKSREDKKVDNNQKRFYPNEIIIMISDIQCRDEEECKKLNPAINNVNSISKAYPDAKITLLIAGDLTENAEDWQIEDYFDKEAHVQADEKYNICGNHDVKKGLEKCLEATDPYPLFYKKEIGNIVLIPISNWHENALRDKKFQRYLPDEGLRFLKEEGLQALHEGKMLFILVHEKPKGVANFADPRILLFWQKYNMSNVYNSDELKKVLSEFSKDECSRAGICVIYIYGHTHTPAHLPDTVIVDDGILFINTSAIRTTDYKLDIGKYGFGFLIKPLMKIFPWNKYSAARVLFLQYDADIAYLATRNLTEDGWYDFIYEIKLSVPFRRE